jgi:hypothetical protein
MYARDIDSLDDYARVNRDQRAKDVYVLEESTTVSTRLRPPPPQRDIANLPGDLKVRRALSEEPQNALQRDGFKASINDRDVVPVPEQHDIGFDCCGEDDPLCTEAEGD